MLRKRGMQLCRYELILILRRHVLWCWALAATLFIWSSGVAKADDSPILTLRPNQGSCASAVAYGAYFPPGSTVIVAGPSVNGRHVAGYTEVQVLVGPDGAFTTNVKPCPASWFNSAGVVAVLNGLQATFTADTSDLTVPNRVGAAATYTSAGTPQVLPKAGVRSQVPSPASILMIGVLLAAVGGITHSFVRLQGRTR